MAPNIRLWKREAEPEPGEEEPRLAEAVSTLATRIFNHKHKHQSTTTEISELGEFFIFPHKKPKLIVQITHKTNGMLCKKMDFPSLHSFKFSQKQQEKSKIKSHIQSHTFFHHKFESN